MKIPNRQILRPSLLPGILGENHPVIIRSSRLNHPTRPASGTRGGQHQPTHQRPICPTALPDQAERPSGIVRYRQAKHPNRQIVKEPKVIEAHQSAEALAKAEGRETDKALQQTLKQLGI